MIICFFYLNIFGQNDTIKLKDVEISTNRISIPFSEKSRTIVLVTSEQIKNSPATSVDEVLQNIAGIDVRRRGVDGMQSDLYIRGGNFEQTLILIDGIKMNDPQTGHHSMNAIIPLENIERIEVIKGPAARVYGQNAFTGAVNIVTKKIFDNNLNVELGYGSYENKFGGISLSKKFENGGILSSFKYQKSDGYRFNTDFENISGFLKTKLNKIDLLASFSERKFGANGFYASPDYKDQYEETQTSLVALGTKFILNSITIKPRIYWRRNQDMYLFLRQDPSYYRNLHISNKIGAETNIVINSSLGKTGIGINLERIFLSSNNLNNHNRTVITSFLEHKFEIGKTADITPGVAISSNSDFSTEFFPGLDIGFRISDKFRFYQNIGFTYRVPTYTDLYYVGPTTLGNPNLEPESALSQEIGLQYKNENFDFDLALFIRNSDNLIDWTKDNEADKWEARNFSEVVTKGFETSMNYYFHIGYFKQKINLAYCFINDDIKDNDVQFTRYSLNSIKHHITSSFYAQLFKGLKCNISYKFVERTDGDSYIVFDGKLLAQFHTKLTLSLSANNIFSAKYSETNLVPMPKGNLMFGVNYKLY